MGFKDAVAQGSSVQQFYFIERKWKYKHFKKDDTVKYLVTNPWKNGNQNSSRCLFHSRNQIPKFQSQSYRYALQSHLISVVVKSYI